MSKTVISVPRNLVSKKVGANNYGFKNLGINLSWYQVFLVPSFFGTYFFYQNQTKTKLLNTIISNTKVIVRKVFDTEVIDTNNLCTKKPLCQNAVVPKHRCTKKPLYQKSLGPRNLQQISLIPTL